jgi:dTDP-4-dehydrorhamnose 3,5-epimerase
VKVIPTSLPEVKIIEPRVFGDDRGFFVESWNSDAFATAGIEARFVQDNHSRSARGVLRGLHYQIARPQGKLVRVVSGSAFDIAVDVRSSSSRFGEYVGIELSVENMRMLWIPPGFAHGFLALEDNTDFLYKCTDYYFPEHERTILWSDPELAIDWPLADLAEPIISAKDLGGTLLAEAEVFP